MVHIEADTPNNQADKRYLVTPTGAAAGEAVSELNSLVQALVDQQRIANLIAYVALLESQFRESVSHPEEFEASTKSAALDRHKAAVRMIREGLGL